MDSIERITLTLWVYDESAGRRSITFDVPLPDEPFLAAVISKWREHYARVVAELQRLGDPHGPPDSTVT